MAELRDKVGVFRRLEHDAKVSQEARGAYRLRNFVNKELDKYRRKYSFMQNVTALDYLEFVVGQSAQQQMQELQDPVPTDSEFWRAVYEYKPFELAPNTHSKLYDYLRMKNLASVPLGMYGGYAQLELVRRMGALPNTETIQNLTNLEYAVTDSGAISYPDAHPSDLESDDYRVRDKDDHRLRRFTSLGLVIHVKSEDSWEYTGHALVVDVGHGRGCHPWFVLASEWERESENAEGSFLDRAPARVAINDANQPGVLPGGQNRTVVGMVEPMDDINRHVLQQFGPGFKFYVKREPPARLYYPEPTRGPDLAHIMTWYWDPVREVEVCYYKDGREYMAYDRKTKYYTYTGLKKHRHSVVGESGMFGLLTCMKTGGYIPLGEQMGPQMLVRKPTRGGDSSSVTTY